MGPFSSARHRIHGHFNNGTILTLGDLNVPHPLHVDYVKGLQDLIGWYLTSCGESRTRYPIRYLTRYLIRSTPT